jgi:hypothetical protein
MRPSSVLGTSAALATAVSAFAGTPVQRDDTVHGLWSTNGLQTIQLIREGSAIPDPWKVPNMAWVEFDNAIAVSHNPDGNLLGVVPFVGSIGSGVIYCLATNGDATASVIGNMIDLGVDPESLTADYLNGLSVNPGNTRIALTDADYGHVIVYDYQPGPAPGTGTGASLSGGRQTPMPLLPGFLDGDLTKVQGTTWLDDDTVLVMSAAGTLYAVNAVTMQHAVLATVTLPGPVPSLTIVIDIEYNRAISPYLYVVYSSFEASTKTRICRLYLFDPRAAYAPVGQGFWTYNTPFNGSREIAFNQSAIC